VEPQIPIKKIIGIKIISKKMKNNNKSKLRNEPKTENSKNKKNAAYKLKNKTFLLKIDHKHNGIIKTVNKTKINENPSTPKIIFKYKCRIT
jgi:hypothetical protein